MTKPLKAAQRRRMRTARIAPLRLVKKTMKMKRKRKRKWTTRKK